MKVSKTNTLLVLGLALLILALAACGPAQDPEDEAATATARAEGVPAEEQEAESNSGEETAGAVEEAPAKPAASSSGDFDIYGGLGEDAFETTPSGLQYAIVEKSEGGKRPEAGQEVAVHYTGWLEDGTSFDSSRERGEPISFPIGQQRVIAGWDEGISLLEEGDKARLIIPGELAYGEAGRPGIPPNATLIFDVELVGVPEGAPEAPTQVDEGDYEVTDSGLKYFDMVAGDGPAPAEGLVADSHYTVWLEDGTLLFSTRNFLQSVPVPIVSGQMLPGMEEGMLSMRAGGSRQLVIPPELAFGEAGSSDGSVPPNASIIMEIELLDVINPTQ